jgi:hypothetical protein
MYMIRGNKAVLEDERVRRCSFGTICSELGRLLAPVAGRLRLVRVVPKFQGIRKVNEATVTQFDQIEADTEMEGQRLLATSDFSP